MKSILIGQRKKLKIMLLGLWQPPNPGHLSTRPTFKTFCQTTNPWRQKDRKPLIINDKRLHNVFHPQNPSYLAQHGKSYQAVNKDEKKVSWHLERHCDRLINRRWGGGARRPWLFLFLHRWKTILDLLKGVATQTDSCPQWFLLAILYDLIWPPLE